MVTQIIESPNADGITDEVIKWGDEDSDESFERVSDSIVEMKVDDDTIQKIFPESSKNKSTTKIHYIYKEKPQTISTCQFQHC